MTRPVNAHPPWAAHALIVLGVWLPGAAPLAQAADLQPRTAAAFERYARATEARLDAEVRGESEFLWTDALSARDRARKLEMLRRGDMLVDRRTTRENGKEIDVPDGIVHHWIGLAFLPAVRLNDTLALLQDYDRHGEIYHPRVERSKLRGRDGDVFRFYLRFFMKKVITVVIDGEHEARFTRLAPDRAYSRIVSTRMAEVENAGTPEEKQKPVGRDGGYLWRLNTYWRLLERDGGTYLQCESISLTRGIPIGLGWLVGPFVNSLPKETLEFTLLTTRHALTSAASR
jgi:hypothetical protein